MPKERVSCGLLLYQQMGDDLRVLLVHPGGPYNVKKDDGYWSVPKGEFCKGEDSLTCARREFLEETGHTPPQEVTAYTALGHIQQKGGKWVHCWAFEGEWDPFKFCSNTWKIEWPPGSGKIQEYPECDRAELFDLETAKRKIKASQIPLLERLAKHLGVRCSVFGVP